MKPKESKESKERKCAECGAPTPQGKPLCGPCQRQEDDDDAERKYLNGISGRLML